MLDELEIRKIVQDEIQRNVTKEGYGVAVPPFHAHTGVDSPKIDYSNLGGTNPSIPKAIGTAKGDIIGFTASATPVRHAVGTDNDLLTADGSSSDGIRWVTPSFINKSIGTTKGDLITFTASATPVRQAAGTNGYVLSADSTQTNGIKWALPIQQADFTASLAPGGSTTTVVTTVTPGFKPLMVMGICEGGVAAGGTTGQSSFFVASPSTTNGLSDQTLAANAANLGTHGAYDATHIGYMRDGAAVDQTIECGTFTDTTFAINWNRTGSNNCGGTVRGVIIGY